MKKSSIIIRISALIIGFLPIISSRAQDVGLNSYFSQGADENISSFPGYWPLSSGNPVPAEALGTFDVQVNKTGPDIPANYYNIVISFPPEVIWTGEPFTLPAEYTLDASSTATSLYIIQTSAHLGSGLAAVRNFSVPVQAVAAAAPSADNWMVQLGQESPLFTDVSPGGNNLNTAQIVVGNVNLPVQFLSFTAVAKGSTAILDWSTGSETNNKGFGIERSNNGKQWQDIGFVPSSAADGNSGYKLDYQYIDKTPLNGQNYYRLKQVDLDGQYVYSTIRTVTFDGNGPNISLYPNPTTGTVYVRGLTGAARIKIQNNIGQVMLLPGNSTGPTIDLGSLSSGVYTITILDEQGGQTNHKIIKIK